MVESSGIGLYQIVVIGLALINGVLVPIMFLFNRSINKNHENLEAHKLYVANNYMTKDDLKDEFKSINDRLEGIWKEIKELRKNGSV